MIIDCIADLHGFYPELEGGDLLIVAGDLTARDEPKQYLQFNEWLKQQEYRRKIVIAGNHDNCLQSGVTVFINPLLANSMIPIYGPDVNYLCDSGCEFEDVKIWGSPWTLKFPEMNPKCMAFTLDTEKQLDEKWSMIPEGIDILVTHAPPIGELDENIEGKACGSSSLRKQLFRIKPIFHCFGHIHEQGGSINMRGYEDKNKNWFETMSLNCSYVNEKYEPVNSALRVVL